MKAILEIKAPKTCYTCQMKYASGYLHKLVCRAADLPIDMYDKSRAPFCPLKIKNERWGGR